MDKQKFNISLVVVIALIVVGGFFGLQNLFLTDANLDQNDNTNQTNLGAFANIETPEPNGDPNKVSEAIFLGGLSEFDLALMADDSSFVNDYNNIINQTSEIYENEI